MTQTPAPKSPFIPRPPRPLGCFDMHGNPVPIDPAEYADDADWLRVPQRVKPLEQVLSESAQLAHELAATLQIGNLQETSAEKRMANTELACETLRMVQTFAELHCRLRGLTVEPRS